MCGLKNALVLGIILVTFIRIYCLHFCCSKSSSASLPLDGRDSFLLILFISDSQPFVIEAGWEDTSWDISQEILRKNNNKY